MTRSTKTLDQHLGIGCVIAQIDNDERFVVVKAINRCQRFGARTSVQPLRQFMEIFEPDSPGANGLLPPTTAVERSFVCADIMRDDDRP